MSHIFKRRDGTPHNPKYCKAAIFGGRCSINQCTNSPKRDGWCGIHHPDAVAKRKAKSDAYYKNLIAERDKKWDKARREQQFADDCEAAVKAIAEGHNDPRTLCLEILATRSK